MARPLHPCLEHGSGGGADSVWAQNIAPLLATAFAGSLGGSVGALINMRRATQRGVSFVDRKYSLRGLVLPMLGFVAGLILYPLFGVAFWLLALSPDQLMLVELLPVSVACLFGFFQESIYGTRE
jgi:type IV secretory pathway TrbD component